MKYHLHKMHGCGNDFLFVDALRHTPDPPFTRAEAIYACDRNYGLGADGIAILTTGRDTDAQWDFFNCDGSRAEMCGNAARCAILFLADRHFKDKEIITLGTDAGIVKGRKLMDGVSEVSMPVSMAEFDRYTERSLKYKDQVLRMCLINTGVPHAVIEVKDLATFPKEEVGQFLVKHELFGNEGTNVTYFECGLSNEIRSATFERGVEKVTFACGTGVVAAGIIYTQVHLQSFPVTVITPGGKLEVDLSPHKKAVLLRGPAQYVYETEFECSLQNFSNPSVPESGIEL